MSESDISHKVRDLALMALLIAIWLILGMVFLERFIPPFDRLQQWLMPWKGLIPAEADLDRRLSLMQSQLEASIRVARYALVIMIVSFTALSMYLSVVYQQKQRRARENMLLVLKNQEI